MNRKLTDAQIRTVIEERQAAGLPVTRRAVASMLRERFAASGKSTRIAAVCASINKVHSVARDEIDRLKQELTRARAESEQAMARALRSEERERAHQDHWAQQIYDLRQSVAVLKGERAQRAALEEQVLRLHRVLHSLQSHGEWFESSSPKILSNSPSGSKI